MAYTGYYVVLLHTRVIRVIKVTESKVEAIEVAKKRSKNRSMVSVVRYNKTGERSEKEMWFFNGEQRKKLSAY